MVVIILERLFSRDVNFIEFDSYKRAKFSVT